MLRPPSVTVCVAGYCSAHAPLSTLPRIAVTGAILRSSSITSGRPISPPCTICATPANCCATCGRNRPWVSEMTPILSMTHLAPVLADRQSRSCRSPAGTRYQAAMTDFATLKDFIDRHQRLFVLTGAGCSTNSGIPDYRDGNGDWKRTQPGRFQAFVADEKTRQRYWARSMVGWRRFGRAQPNDAHHALARLEESGRSQLLLTQNVDRLHQAAGSREVIDLHGRLDLVRCMACSNTIRRADFQDELVRLNPAWVRLDAA